MYGEDEMSELTDFGIENPVSQKKFRFKLKKRDAFGIWDNKVNYWIDMAVDLDETGKAKPEMEGKIRELEEKEGKYLNPEVKQDE